MSPACKSQKLIAAGYLEDNQSFVAIANSKGNFGYQRSTMLDYTCTVRTEDGRGSGWVGTDTQDAARFKADSDIQIAMRKASASSEAKALEPGKYTVILEPMAAAGLIGFMFYFFGAREADEGRSFLSKKGGGNKLGEQVYGPQVTMFTDPAYPGAAVFSHFVALNAAVSAATGGEAVMAFRPDHTSVTVFEVGENGLILIEKGREASTGVL